VPFVLAVYTLYINTSLYFCSSRKFVAGVLPTKYEELKIFNFVYDW
jgi:hypothetical protein